MAGLPPKTMRVLSLLQNEEQGQLEKIAYYYDGSGRLIEEYKTFPDQAVGDAALGRFFHYVGADITGQTAFSTPWTQDMEDKANPPALPLSGITLTNTSVVDGDPAGTVVGQLFAVGGQAPFSFTITSDPDNIFQLSGNQLQLSGTADIADTPYSVTIEVEDGAAQTFSQAFSIAVTPSFVNTTSTEFDGINEECEATSSTVINQSVRSQSAWTINFWLRVDAIQEMNIFTNALNNVTRQGITIFTDSSNRINAAIAHSFNSGNYIQRRNNADLNPGEWYFVSVAYDGTEVANGISIKLNNFTGNGTVVDNLTTSVSPAADVRLGDGTVNWGTWYDGQIDEISIYDRELSSSEIDDIYNSGSPPDLSTLSTAVDLIEWWRMGENAIFPTIPGEQGVADLTMINMTAGNFKANTP